MQPILGLITVQKKKKEKGGQSCGVELAVDSWDLYSEVMHSS